MVDVFNVVEAAVGAEQVEGYGEYGSFVAFDTLIVHRQPVPAGALNWTLLNEFCYFASLIYLRLFIEHDVLIRGVAGITTDFRIDGRVLTIAEIDRMFALEKAQESATVLVDMKPQIDRFEGQPDPGRYTTPDRDPYLFHPVVFKGNSRPSGLSSSPLAREHVPVLRLLNQRTVRHLMENNLSFLAALTRLQQRAADPVLPEEVRRKLTNTLAFLSADLEHYNTQGKPLQTKLRELFNSHSDEKLDWHPVP
jgi:hypothetical protein